MKKAKLIVIVEKAVFYDEKNLGWHIDAFDETAIKEHNERYGTNYVAGQLSKADRIVLSISSSRSTLETNYNIAQNWLQEHLMWGFYGALVQPAPYGVDYHLKVKTAIEQALLSVDFDNVEQGKKFEIEIFY